MATFSPMPSPAPRRTTRRTPQPTTARSPPPITVAKRTRTRTAATPTRGRLSVLNDDAASVTSGMDVDVNERPGRSDTTTLFAKSQELTVSFYANLPVEVKQVLKNADFYADDYTGDIDTLTGFAIVASAQTCFVWQHAQALKGTPTCYIFSCPLDYTQKATPFHILVPYGTSREPGLVLISLEGEVRFWDSIGIGLAGGDHFSTSSLELSSGEIVTNLIRSDPQTFIASSSTGRLFRITLTSSGGKYHLTSHPFSRPQSALSFSRLLPSLWSSSASLQPEAGNTSAIALGAESTLGRDVWALVDTRVQRWSMAVEGWEEATLDEELAEFIRPVLRETFSSVSEDNSTLDLELLDLAVESSGNLIILVSYAGVEEETAMEIGTHPRRIYALVRLSHVSDVFKVESLSSVPYQSTSSSGAPMHPRIQLLLDGSLVSIQFGDAVALCARDSEYRDRLELKSATDRTLGVGVLEDESALLVLTAATMMKAYVDMDRVASFDPETGRANLIKSIMSQAILYGSYAENPLHFSFPPEVDEDGLMLGAEQLSSAVLESDTEVVPPNHDLSAQLTGRKERLSWLIRFINDNAVLTKMSQSSRQRLATDAEKLYACHQLWLQHNDFLAAGHTRSVLNEVVYAYMEECGESHHEDIVRAFFRLKVGDIGKLLSRVMDVAKRISYELPGGLSESLPEANRIVLTVLKSAFDYRNYNIGVYGIELPMLKPWTSKPAVIDTVLGLFDTTTKLVESAATTNGEAPNVEPNAQLPELASILFACIRERLDWLGSAAAADQAGIERDHKELAERFSQLRPEVLETLRRNGHAAYAFNLAEDYRDFRSLASLCHKDVVYPPDENPNVLRIQSYIERFKEEFTTELYQWYIEHGELRAMFAQEDVYGGYMDKFFADHPNASVSWVHDLGMGRHGAASQTLLNEALDTKDLATKHLMLSIGKLAHLAQLHETEASVDESTLDAFHDDLDFVSVHEALLQDLKAPLHSVRSKQSLDSQVESIANAKATLLTDKRALLNVLKHLIRELLQGKALSIEDTVDVLSLKDNIGNVDNYVTALHLLFRDQVLPSSRKISAFRCIWRRIYNHDDWGKIQQTSGVTDIELIEKFQNTALYAAIRAVLPRQHQPEGYDLTPDQALPIPSMSEIASRWPGMAPDQVEALVLDYRAESTQLERLKLDDVYQRVRELAIHDVVYGPQS